MTKLRRRLSRPSLTTSRGRADPIFPEIRFRVDFGDRCSVGVGKVRLLEAVEHAGSLSRAAREIGMSYRRAWLLIDSMNAEFDLPVVSTSVGGRGGGGAKVTPFGKKLIEAYRGLETRLALLATDSMAEIGKHAVAQRGRSAAHASSRKSIARPLKPVTSR